MIFAFFRTLKTNLTLVFVAIGGILLTALKVQSARLGRAKDRIKRHRAEIKHTKKVMAADKEIENQADDRLVDAVNEISEDGTTDELSDPNEW